MSSIYGIWKHEATYGDSVTTITQTIREDGSYETHMIYSMAAGCQQHIYHYGTADIDATTLSLNFLSGKTKMSGCQDHAQNFELRDFTEPETEEAKGLLAQTIPYAIDGDTLTTTVKGPMGEMHVVYKRHVE